MTSGIYLITNKINGHKYVGGSVEIERRFSEHKRGVNANNQAIDKAILKYGKENFTYQIITELPADWNTIGKHEKYWIKYYNTFKNRRHYNLTEGDGGISGFKHSEESKKKISKNNNQYYKGKTRSLEDKLKRSKALNTTGYFRVSKIKCNNKQGFRWRYRYTEYGKEKKFYSVDINKLEKKVLDKGLPWIKLEEV